MDKKSFWAALLVVCMGFVVFSQVSHAKIKIGIMVPTTGSEATYGKDMENAIKMTREQAVAAVRSRAEDGGPDAPAEVERELVGEVGVAQQQLVADGAGLVGGDLLESPQDLRLLETAQGLGGRDPDGNRRPITAAPSHV